ncbi:tRNA pseudouridine synthase A [Rothia sp. AR01]|uniref:tRNA pseudouridine synthase A n=1 Tax=Rothia santali TaxID=2949643 RepID=A0A9X2KKC2_9MICC|nr:tRNA pseudouridine synthase A [Rothia santali]MCP3424901.1 tRNA pseudouridine synthase A [Rothia santali]
MPDAAHPPEHPLGAEAATSAGTVRVRMDLAYDGSCFSGWAKQPGLVTVEGCLEEAIELVLREPVRLTVAGRTDAGVHAGHQVLHLDVPAPRWEALPGRSGDAPGEALARKANGALNRVLGAVGRPPRPGARPAEIGAVEISSAREVPASFDARFSALSRTYLYRIADGPRRRRPLNRASSWALRDALEVEALNRAAEPLLGLHDFLSFCKPRLGATTVRELQELSFARGEGGLIEATVRADAFCHNMVRALIGACVGVAEGKRDAGWIAGRIESPVRDSSIRLAPPEGLMLQRIDYPESPADWAGRAEATRARRA